MEPDQLTPTEVAQIRSLLAMVPPGASVVASIDKMNSRVTDVTWVDGYIHRTVRQQLTFAFDITERVVEVEDCQ